MCRYLIADKGVGLCLPVEDALGEEQVIMRALNLLPEFPDLKLFKEFEGGCYSQVPAFLKKKHERQKEILFHRRRQQVSHVQRD
ncbi:hypothetical protein JXK06_01905 [Patescibacteria group bacterium]|nr:hypothetical protein [Patescibacteria group bacterium]